MDNNMTEVNAANEDVDDEVGRSSTAEYPILTCPYRRHPDLSLVHMVIVLGIRL